MTGHAAPTRSFMSMFSPGSCPPFVWAISRGWTAVQHPHTHVPPFELLTRPFNAQGVRCASAPTGYTLRGTVT